MLITRECDYSLRILRALSQGETINVPTIAEMENISVAITYKLTRKLEKAGIIRSFRGAKGGYKLQTPLDELTLYDVFVNIEREFLLTECLEDQYDCVNNSSEKSCQFHNELCRIQKVLLKECQSKSIAEILSSEDFQETAEEKQDGKNI
ncbi:MAG: Rrf2 family transcriptional regulator [Clostridiales bacterium]|nr:Rrf2 family transcriptional regulator [Clostridiales bacterium]